MSTAVLDSQTAGILLEEFADSQSEMTEISLRLTTSTRLAKHLSVSSHLEIASLRWLQLEEGAVVVLIMLLEAEEVDMSTPLVSENSLPLVWW